MTGKVNATLARADKGKMVGQCMMRMCHAVPVPEQIKGFTCYAVRSVFKHISPSLSTTTMREILSGPTVSTMVVRCQHGSSLPVPRIIFLPSPNSCSHAWPHPSRLHLRMISKYYQPVMCGTST